MSCGCNKKDKTQEIGTSNNVDNDFLPVAGLDLTEKIDIGYLNTDSTKFPNDELERVDGEPYGTEPPHEPFLSEFYPELSQALALNNSLPYPHDDQHSENYVATGAKPDSQPEMTNEEGHMSTHSNEVQGLENQGTDDLIFNLPPTYTQETEKKMAKYVRYPHRNDILCEAFDGRIIDMNGEGFRPIPPTEDAERSNTGTNCKCYWLIIEDPDRGKSEKPRNKDGTFKDPHNVYNETVDYSDPKKHRFLAEGSTGDDANECQSCGYPKEDHDLNFKESAVDIENDPQFDSFTHSSSFVGNVKYDRTTQKMDVILNGKTYTFCRVPERTFQAFKGANSKGAEFNRFIKKLHTCGIGETTKEFITPIQETITIKETLQELHTQFNWFTDDYLAKIAELDKRVGGKFILVRASAETITDHRSEGEPYRRLLKGEELMQLTRTGIGKSTDINHLGLDFKVDSRVLDAEYDPIRKESQMLVHLNDSEILNFIRTGQIASVSINAGAPRTMNTECSPEECFVVPTGLILGELDNIAFTWVVDDPAGIVWHGKYVPRATAGVKTTKIEIIEV